MSSPPLSQCGRGSLINRDISTLNNLLHYPWLLYPALLLLIVTLAFNFVGDVLRDYDDPYHNMFPQFKLLKFFSRKKQAKKAKTTASNGGSE